MTIQSNLHVCSWNKTNQMIDILLRTFFKCEQNCLYQLKNIVFVLSITFCSSAIVYKDREAIVGLLKGVQGQTVIFLFPELTVHSPIFKEKMGQHGNLFACQRIGTSDDNVCALTDKPVINISHFILISVTFSFVSSTWCFRSHRGGRESPHSPCNEPFDYGTD